MKWDTAQLQWTRAPQQCHITPEKIEICTMPHTDLWQRTYYHFRNDSAPVLQMRTDDFRVECSEDGSTYRQMRICHLWEGSGPISFGLYACSPQDSSFRAVFPHMEMTECLWQAHDGQAPDETL